MLEQLETILGILAGALGISTTFILKLIKSGRARKFLENYEKLASFIIPFLEEAEKFVNFTGAEKKAYVMTKVLKIVNDKKMKIGEDLIEQKIEELINLTKKVNTTISNKDEIGGLL